MAYQTIELSNSRELAGVTIVAKRTPDAFNDVQEILIRRRTLPETAYTTIARIPITSLDDLNFSAVDSSALSGNTYQYMLMPVSNGVQGLGVSASIACDLPFLHIQDESGELFAYLDINITEQVNTTVGYVKPLWGRFPHVIRNSNTNYATGSVDALFLPFDSSCEPDVSMATRSRANALALLTNGLTKVLRTPDGRGWVVSIDGTPTVKGDGFMGAETIMFNWTEVAEFPKGKVKIL